MHVIAVMAPEATAEGRGRIVHALHTARELANRNQKVGVVFAGIGVTCLSAFAARDNPFTQNYGELFDAVLPLVGGACDFCARNRFDAADAARSLGVDLIGGEGRHHDLAELLGNGWTVTTF